MFPLVFFKKFGLRVAFFCFLLRFQFCWFFWCLFMVDKLQVAICWWFVVSVRAYFYFFHYVVLFLALLFGKEKCYKQGCLMVNLRFKIVSIYKRLYICVCLILLNHCWCCCSLLFFSLFLLFWWNLVSVWLKYGICFLLWLHDFVCNKICIKI